MKNSTIRERHAALTALSQRVLPSRGAVNKVAALLATRFREPYLATEQGRKQVFVDLPAPEGWEEAHLPPLLAEQRQKWMDEYLEESTPVRKVPASLRLTSADLPVPLKREGGESNVEGLASIILMLGSLYVPSDEELRLRDPAIDESLDGEETE